ncbi:response regulator [Terricaulis silvestris]|uniref:Chemotaxis protein CheY n=1 Tax=Terricaulis silvestris TaxID=2686094 RepID=A0A6I6MML1_9CAUL|nr:response regulator [Terricaulis silvestris]QGZ94204.1 Chemotaxis protein CheY [Terricaulis silvestris]
MFGGGQFDPSGLTALVLDDNHYERGISLDQLRAMGFGRVIGAANTVEAWQALRGSNPNIVLMEWIEDANDGLDFVRRVRMSEELPNRAVSMFMLTTSGAASDVEAARLAGIDGYLRKPISALALQQRVRTVIANPQPFVVTSAYVGPCRRRRRPDLNYLGPLRRLDDEAPEPLVSGDDEELNLKSELARACVAKLEGRAKSLAAGDAKAARDVYKAVQDLVDVGEQIGDPSLTLGAREMARYLTAQGATDRLDPEVVRTHVAALHQLVHLPHALCEERQRVAESLKRMVDKKLRQADAA